MWLALFWLLKTRDGFSQTLVPFPRKRTDAVKIHPIANDRDTFRTDPLIDKPVAHLV